MRTRSCAHECAPCPAVPSQKKPSQLLFRPCKTLVVDHKHGCACTRHHLHLSRDSRPLLDRGARLAVRPSVRIRLLSAGRGHAALGNLVGRRVLGDRGRAASAAAVVHGRVGGRGALARPRLVRIDRVRRVRQRRGSLRLGLALVGVLDALPRDAAALGAALDAARAWPLVVALELALAAQQARPLDLLALAEVKVADLLSGALGRAPRKAATVEAGEEARGPCLGVVPHGHRVHPAVHGALHAEHAVVHVLALGADLAGELAVVSLKVAPIDGKHGHLLLEAPAELAAPAAGREALLGRRRHVLLLLLLLLPGVLPAVGLLLHEHALLDALFVLLVKGELVVERHVASRGLLTRVGGAHGAVVAAVAHEPGALARRGSLPRRLLHGLRLRDLALALHVGRREELLVGAVEGHEVLDSCVALPGLALALGANLRGHLAAEGRHR
mmetsp:Transcript_64344/g.158329  ORF Transcript_64344/g.158329 Transcript_64344/m.158329 type:complete len:444 (-) Transcript_64344:461-1792(-)